ncbi:penicillin-binding protein [Pseudolabrys taiwanensis]|uniref:Penicillin-binding protein n=1 Tax=Pseudolabrys taiwanensis TaxID=331696 RepID=A0A345ZYX1_9HYPH|nr:transglycosylase domain-containing protein [Pseudolabrys taiwanensis]AXK82118.1 penicillin-binding protein [Pseudolabrys taiwanensis]
MASGRGQSGGRREPAFDAAPPVRVSAGERPSGGSNKPAPRRKKSKKSKRNRRPLLVRMAYWCLVLGLWLGIGALGAVLYVGAHLPPIQSLEIPKRPPSIQIVDDDGHALARRGDLAGAPLSLKEMPPYVPRAFVAIEDRRFYDHYGVDPLGIARALVANVLHRGVAQGGSTITQQLAKNLFLTQERTLTRKVQEALLSLWLERKFSKTQIMELYLNRVYFGAGAYGIEQASQRYFGKSAKQLTVAEAALLAGLVKSPSRLAPTRNFDAAENRAKIVLAAMAELGFINAATEKVALAKPPRIVAQAANGSINYVADWVMDVLNDVLGHVEQDVIVYTTIDGALQTTAEKALTEELAAKGDKAGVGQGALVAMTPDGAVRVMVGGRNYAESQFNRAVAAKRQPGSAFKPFVYLTALEHGLTPDTIREDRPINIKGWQPENYGREYYGPVTLTKALAMSLNTVSVRLTMEMTPMAVIRTAHRLGIASRLEANASIALGTSEVSMLELVGAYAPFANGGYAIVPHVIDRVTLSNGKVLYARSNQQFGRIIDARYVAMMNAMMTETLTIGTAHKATLPGWPAAGKTGTSQDFRDAWFIGYTSNLVTGVWLGNDDGSPTKKVTGGGMPVEIWSRFMRAAHQGVPVANLPGSEMRSSGGFLSNLFGGGNDAPAPRSATAAPTPPAPVQSANNAPPARDGASLDGYLLQNLFGRR